MRILTPGWDCDEPPRGLDPVHHGHVDVHEHDVGAERGRLLQRLGPVLRETDDLDVLGVVVQEGREALEEEALVVGDEHPDLVHAASSLLAGRGGLQAAPGRRGRSRPPGARPISTDAAQGADALLHAREADALHHLEGALAVVGDGQAELLPPSTQKLTRTRVALPWRTAFVSASCTVR